MDPYRLFAALILTGLLFWSYGPAFARKQIPDSGTVRIHYKGTIMLPDGGHQMELWITRDPMAVRTKRGPVVRGWRFHGGGDIDSELYFTVYGTSASIERPGTDWSEAALAVDGDSVRGYLEGRFTDSDTLHMQLRWLAPGTAPSACTLIAQSREADTSGVYFDADFIPFWNRFQDAVRRDDAKAVAAMTLFPLEWASCLLSDYYGDNSRLTRSRFLKHFSEIFEREKELLLDMEPLQLDLLEYIPGEYFVVPALRRGDILYFYERAGIEFNQWLHFARIRGEYKLVYCTCAG